MEKLEKKEKEEIEYAVQFVINDMIKKVSKSVKINKRSNQHFKLKGELEQAIVKLNEELKYNVQLVMSALITKVIEQVQTEKRSITHHDSQGKQKKKRISYKS